MIIGTVATNSRLAGAKVLAQSVKSHHPDVKVIVSLVERHMDPDIPEFPCFDEVILAKDTWNGNFDQTIFKYEAWEACCFAKAPLLDYLFKKYPQENHILFLDSDMEIIAPLLDLAHRFERSSILLTPQHLYEGVEYDDFKYGVYNAGFIGVSRTPEGLRFVKWWGKRLERYSYFEENDTLYAEQKWLNLVPAVFNGVEVVKHPGYGLASWNFPERKVTISDGGQYLVNGEPLYVLHHRGINKLETDVRQAEFYNEHPEIASLVERYADKLDREGRASRSSIPWSYQFFTDGTVISRESRLVYRNNLHLEKKHPNPFLLNNEFFANYKPAPEQAEEVERRHAKRKRKRSKKARRPRKASAFRRRPSRKKAKLLRYRKTLSEIKVKKLKKYKKREKPEKLEKPEKSKRFKKFKKLKDSKKFKKVTKAKKKSSAPTERKNQRVRYVIVNATTLEFVKTKVSSGSSKRKKAKPLHGTEHKKERISSYPKQVKGVLLHAAVKPKRSVRGGKAV